jgi:hypothetical protein
MAARRLQQLPRERPPERYDRAYWLTRCQGFAVEAAGVHLGVVTEVRYASRADIPDLIVVRTGHLRHGLLLIPVEQVEGIDVSARLLELTDEAAAR